jgi:DNA-binding LytR/AlgR family response regulator
MNKHDSLIVFDRLELRMKIKSGWISISYDKIVEVYKDMDYSIVRLSDNQKYYIDIPIKVFAEILPLIFFRYKRSGIINLAYIHSFFIEHRKLRIILKDGASHYVSRYLSDAFHLRINSLPRISLPCEKCLFCTKKEHCEDFSPFSLPP